MTTLVADHPGGTETRHDRNKERIANPQPGDYWHEMFCPVLVVVEADADGLLVCDKTRAVDSDHWTWDLSRCRRMTREEMRMKLSYKSPGMEDKFWADCSPKQHTWVVEATYTELPREPTFADLYQ